MDGCTNVAHCTCVYSNNLPIANLLHLYCSQISQSDPHCKAGQTRTTYITLHVGVAAAHINVHVHIELDQIAVQMYKVRKGGGRREVAVQRYRDGIVVAIS